MRIRASRSTENEPVYALWDEATGKRVGVMKWHGGVGWCSRNTRGLMVVRGEKDLRDAIRKHQAIINRGTRVAR